MQVWLSSNDTNKIFNQLYMHWHDVTCFLLYLQSGKGTIMYKIKNNNKKVKTKQWKPKSCNKLSKVLLSRCHIRLQTHLFFVYVMLQAPHFSIQLAGNTLKYVCNVENINHRKYNTKQDPLHWLEHNLHIHRRFNWMDCTQKKKSLNLAFSLYC